MGASFLITLREGLEIALVLAILIAYLVKSGRSSEVQSVWRGAAWAAAVCVVAGVAFHVFVGEFEGKAEQFIEGTIAIAAAAVLTWMIFWMRQHARDMGTQLRSQLDAASSSAAIVTIAFVAVIREGLETVLFLISAETSSSSGMSVVLGGLCGLIVAAVLGRMFYVGGSRLNLRVFFNVTGVLLILFAAGLFGKFFHEYRELFGFESGWLISSVWSFESGVWAGGTFYDFMSGFFGWHREFETVRLLAYVGYLLPVMWLFLRDSASHTSAKVSTAEKVAGRIQ